MVFLSPRQRSFVMLTTAVLIFTISLLITFAIQTVTFVLFGLKFAKVPAGVVFAVGSLAFLFSLVPAVSWTLAVISACLGGVVGHMLSVWCWKNRNSSEENPEIKPQVVSKQ